MSAKQSQEPLRAVDLPSLTTTLPLKTCRICVIVPVRNEAEHLPNTLGALAQQVDSQGRPLNPDSYEVLVLANNCSDGSAAIAAALGKVYPALHLHVLEVTLPAAQATVGGARRLVMNEAYRRLALIEREHPAEKRRLIASTDGDTEVAATWLATLLSEFDQGVDAVCGRILTRRTVALGIQAETSLYFLRYMAHRYLTAQIEAFLDPLPHDCWPRHYQHFGANMGVSSEIYGRVGGIPNVQNQEDVALYRRLQQVDAKIRHSPHVRVTTSARRTGRTSGGLAERLSQLTQAGRQRRAVLVESPQLTEARILVRNQLRQIWTAINCNACSLTLWSARISLLAESLGLAEAQLQQAIAIAPTFGLLLEAVELEQKQGADTSFWLHATTEISLANMHLRQRLQGLRQQWAASAATLDSLAQPYDLPGNGLETLKQIQPIPLFSLTY